MVQLKMDKDIIITKIKEAFMPEKYPGDDNIVYDNTGNYLDVEEIKQKFTGKLWRELDNDFLFYNRDGLYFFSKIGFKYYIPAFMIATINDFNGMDEVPDIVIGKLLLPDRDEQLKFYEGLPPEHEEYKQTRLATFEKDFEESLKTFFEMMKEFNKEQCEVIKLYLEYMKKYTDELYESHDPKIALERYWKNT